jgi:hypothetical protein
MPPTCLRLLTLGRNGVDFINEDDGWRILLSLLKRLRDTRGVYKRQSNKVVAVLWLQG